MRPLAGDCTRLWPTGVNECNGDVSTVTEVSKTKAVYFPPMNPKYRVTILFGSVLVLMVPYLGFVVYYSQRFPPNHWPTWFTNTIAGWFVANFLLLMLLAKRIFTGQAAEPQRDRRAFTICTNRHLVPSDCVEFAFSYGAKETIKGEVPLSRAIPAGSFLLFFIGIFGWSLYRARRRKA